MEHFIELNLHNDSEKGKAENLPRPEHQESAEHESAEREKGLNRVAKMAAHKAAKHLARERFGIFSK